MTFKQTCRKPEECLKTKFYDYNLYNRTAKHPRRHHIYRHVIATVEYFRARVTLKCKHTCIVAILFQKPQLPQLSPSKRANFVSKGLCL